MAFGIGDTVFSTTPPPATLLNFGQITVDQGSNAIQRTFDLLNNSLFWNEAGGSVSVTGQDNVFGTYGLAYYNPTEFHNSGTFSVTATNGSATGAHGEGAYYTITNDGLLSVSATALAVGVDLGLFGTLNNSGTIDVESSGGSAFGVTVGNVATIINSGTIIAHGDSDSAAITMGFIPVPMSIYNSGTIEGQIEFFGFDGGSATLTNASTGHILGDINFSDGPDGFGSLSNNAVIHNDGTIAGIVDLGTGNDTFDGAGMV
jgi:hypothetical protein